MNEQMKSKLHELADTCKHPDNYHQGPWMDYIQFAELIVRECAMFVVTELEGKVGSAIADATANRLEEHFGVE